MHFRCYWAIAICGAWLGPQIVWGQALRPIRTFSTEGSVRSVQAGRLVVTDATGKAWQLFVGQRKDGRVALGGSRVFVAPPAKITVLGELELSVLQPGMPIRFESYLDERDGSLAGPVSKLLWVDESNLKPGVKTNRQKKDAQGNVACQISGTVDSFNRNRLALSLPRSRYADKGRMVVGVAEDAKVIVQSRSLTKIREGDRVSKVAGVELNSGDMVVQELEVRLVGEAKTETKPKRNTARAEHPVDVKYEALSTEPVAPRDVRSQHYLMHTDLSDRDAKILLDKLEEMLSLLVRYYGRPQPAPVECYVVADLNAWPAGLFPEHVRKKIADKEGITESLTAVNSRGLRSAKATVFACGKMGVVQHEAVHAYCRLAFGSTGPLWYAEGMAEIGQYWKESQLAVDVDPRVIKFFKKTTSPRSVREILTAEQITGDTWVEYNWRWALCHMLAFNPNYSRTFKELGIGLMLKSPGATFPKAFGKVSKELIFEFDQFLKHIDNGYRTDLCAWRWKHQFEPVSTKGHSTVKVAAKAGWQPAVEVETEIDYEYVAKGEWQIEGTGTKTSADGDEEKNGQLTAVVMQGYELGEPFPLGRRGTFTVPKSGRLYVRCSEAWSRLGDNSGSITVYLRRGKP